MTAQPDSVEIAVAYISTHIAEPLTTETIAAAAGVSPGAVQREFRARFGISSLQYLQGLRFEGARAELGSAGDEPLADVIRRWGFVHAGRFAETYFRRHGVHPGTEP
jgi:AraC-like DNA-binding protein